MPPTPININRLDISGKRDVVMGKYCAWQKQHASRERGAKGGLPKSL
jgi:hypothetical protein